MQNTFLRTDERQHLGLGVELDVVPATVELGHRLAQLGRTHRGLIAVSVRLVGHLAQFLDGLWRGRHVGTANGQRDDVLALGIHLSHLLEFATEVVLLY